MIFQRSLGWWLKKGVDRLAHIAHQVVAFITGSAIAQFLFVVFAQGINFLAGDTADQVVAVGTSLALSAYLLSTVLDGHDRHTVPHDIIKFIPLVAAQAFPLAVGRLALGVGHQAQAVVLCHQPVALFAQDAFILVVAGIAVRV